MQHEFKKKESGELSELVHTTSNPSKNYKLLKRVSHRMISKILPKESLSCDVLTSFLIEIFSTGVLAGLVDTLSEPFYLNGLLKEFLKLNAKNVRKIRQEDSIGGGILGDQLFIRGG
jgi:hypothetical protein